MRFLLLLILSFSFQVSAESMAMMESSQVYICGESYCSARGTSPRKLVLNLDEKGEALHVIRDSNYDGIHILLTLFVDNGNSNDCMIHTSATVENSDETIVDEKSLRCSELYRGFAINHNSEFEISDLSITTNIRLSEN